MKHTRYFEFWHDGSTIGNHSHLLITEKKNVEAIKKI